ncbi:MAG: DISARM system SNF2-like helicase DrmD [Myxococcales bacterium]|nr:DISARM system SNF2-like helicase DrmD [Myxococcales bacterium]
MTDVSSRSVLAALPKARLVDLGRSFGVALSTSATKEQQVDALLGTGLVRFRELLQRLGREELRGVCRAHGLDDSGRARPLLAARILEAHGAADTVPPKPLFSPGEAPRYAPRPGDIVVCRHRQWLVEEVHAPPEPGQLTRVCLVCLDDDDPGRALDVMWERELGAKVIQPEAHGLGEVTHVDPPRYFGAYLHALKWHSVTATDAKLFQAPFRAGIQLMDHQLTPLRKALSLPRANLFIADDVGLGKTIEAGLVLQELQLRQRVEYVLVVCPASVALQWREEMSRRFGLYFEIMNRAFIARRRQERGFGVNPWSTHHRFIISHQTLRRPEYRDPLLQHIGERAKKSLLILDEAHVAAPASATKYAIDSRITKVIRDVAPRFENRLFLSATPHNGHSNSFSALLEILDPQRFTRGVKVQGASQLDAVMVRRLKEDLRQLGVEHFPLRKLVQVNLHHEGGRWSSKEQVYDPSTKRHESGHGATLGEGEPVELRLSEMLAEYASVMRPTVEGAGKKKAGRGRLVFINLQKRLLSSVEAFARTLRLHADAVREGRAATQLDLSAALPSTSDRDDDEYGEDDEQLEAEAGAEIALASQLLVTPEGRARQLLDDMLGLAERHRHGADAKARALVEWIGRHQCAAVAIGGATKASAEARAWAGTRVLLFTEYGDTKRWLGQLLRAAIAGTDRADERILELHGGMSDEQREEVQRAFNAPPDEHPVRILLATDAAREGVNLQGHCADLFHFDVPWNPARMEQRNGRIDRTLQPSPVVRCHYFLYPQRKEDLVLAKLAEKVETIQRELGSLGAVLMDRLSDALANGIEANTADALDEAMETRGFRETTKAELESQRDDRAKLREEIEEAGEILNRSRKVLDFDPALLRDAIDVGLELAGADKLAPTEREGVWTVPELPDAWQRTLDTLRPPRGRDEPFWEFRKRPPQPVVFRPPPKMNDALVHLHLQHPLVQRILGRFLAQGYGAHDLSRVAVVRTRHDALVRVIAFGRLSLFGPGAVRLHDQLLSVAARWVEGSADPLRPFADEADRKAIELLEQVLTEAPSLDAVGPAIQARVVTAAPALFRDLWPHIRDEADAVAKDALDKLATRAHEESDALRGILEGQRKAIIEETKARAQLALDFTEAEKAQRDQFEADKRYMDDRLVAIQREIETEPQQIEALYRVALHRLEPVGLVVLWPETRG